MPVTTYTWTNAIADSNWFTIGNWTPGGFTPSSITSSEIADIPNGGISIVDTAGGTVSISNAGTIQLSAASGGYAYWEISDAANGTVNLSGGGTVSLSDFAGNAIFSNYSGVTLDNIDNTIQGAGLFSNLTMENGGTIDGNQSDTALTLGAGLNLSNNTGILEGTNGTVAVNGQIVSGGLLIEGSVTQTGAGKVEATSGGAVTINGGSVSGGAVNVDAGGTMELTNSGQIGGGTLNVNGALNVFGSGNVIDATTATATVAGTGKISIANGGELTLGTPGHPGPVGGTAHIANSGTISLNATTGGYAYLLIGNVAGGAVDLSGGGTVSLSDNANNQIYSNYSNVTLDNIGNTIQGAGQINSLTLENGGTIDGNQLDTALTLGSSLNVSDNTGTIEGTNGTVVAGQITAGGLVIDGTVTQTGAGKVEATSGGAVTINGGSVSGGAVNVDAGGTMVLTNSGQIGGGTLNVTGALNVFNSGNVIDATTGTATVAGTGQISITNGGELTLGTPGHPGPVGGTAHIANSGTISLNATTGGYAYLLIGNVAGGAVDLSGGGTGVVSLSDNANNQIYSNYSGVTLDNIDNTIQGAGQISSLTLENGGTIDGNQSDTALTLASSLNVSNNTGTIEGTNGTVAPNGQITAGGLVIQGTVTQTGAGKVEAANGGAVTINGGSVSGGAVNVDLFGTMELTGGGQISGGTLNVNGALNVFGSGNVIDATTGTTTVAGPGQISIANGGQLTFGTAGGGTANIDNQGLISLNATSGGYAYLLIGNVSGGLVGLYGGGLVSLSDNANNQIFSNYGNVTLDNVDNTIQGAGQFYNLTLVNGGTIDGNQSDNALTLESSLTVYNNTGTMEGTAGTVAANGQITSGGLVIQGSVTQTGPGKVEATSGGAVTISGGSVSGGAVDVDAGGTMVLTNGGQIGGGTLNVNGALNVFNSGNVIDATKATATVAGTGQLSIANGGQLTLGTALGHTANIDNKGTISLNATSGGYAYLIVGNATGGTVDLSGGGVVSLSDNANNQIYSNYSNVTLDNIDNTIQGAGQINGGSGALNMDNGGTIDASGTSNALQVDNFTNLSNTSTIESTGAGGLTLSADTINNAGGFIEANATGVSPVSTSVLIQNSTVTGGTIEADASAGHTATVTIDPSTISGADLLAANGGSITVDAGTTVNNTDTATLENGGSINFQTDFTGPAFFTGTGNTLSLTNNNGDTSGLISGFTSGDKIDLTNLNISGATIQSETVMSGRRPLIKGFLGVL